MKIQFASDLHLEFKENSHYMKLYPLEPVAPYLILAGDITVIKEKEKAGMSFLKYVSENWKVCYIIPGNHEFYGDCDMANAFNFQQNIFENVKYVNHQKVTIEGVDIFFTTLWSHCDSEIEEIISDFKVCLYNNEPYSFAHHNMLHNQSIDWLKKVLSQSKTNPRVVVSHFVPCAFADAYSNTFSEKQRIIKDYYTAALDQYLDKWDIDYWIYGHNHWNKDSKFQNTHFVSNMLGYVVRDEHNRFKTDKVIDLSSLLK